MDCQSRARSGNGPPGPPIGERFQLTAMAEPGFDAARPGGDLAAVRPRGGAKKSRHLSRSLPQAWNM